MTPRFAEARLFACTLAIAVTGVISAKPLPPAELKIRTAEKISLGQPLDLSIVAKAAINIERIEITLAIPSIAGAPSSVIALFAGGLGENQIREFHYVISSLPAGQYVFSAVMRSTRDGAKEPIFGLRSNVYVAVDQVDIRSSNVSHAQIKRNRFKERVDAAQKAGGAAAVPPHEVIEANREENVAPPPVRDTAAKAPASSTDGAKKGAPRTPR